MAVHGSPLEVYGSGSAKGQLFACFQRLYSLPTFEAALREGQWKSKKSGSPVYRIRSSDLPLAYPFAGGGRYLQPLARVEVAVILVVYLFQ